ncbi:P protein-like [Contarinia nasturtii]|uniref:P protein-like n=1 Tax=Contarinia nasturtii TaxID=265458 RepID=UPI0012D454F9|nr:P protein-like [Contarinia nasturtii]
MGLFNKRILRRRRTNEILELYSAAGTDFEVTQEAVEIWRKLPQSIRCDPSFISFRQQYDRTNGQSELETETMTADFENISHDSIVNSEFATITLKDNHEEENRNHFENGENVVHSNDNHHRIADDIQQNKTNTSQNVFKMIKIALLTIVWIMFTAILMSRDEKILNVHPLAIPIGQNKSYVLNEMPFESRFAIIVYGAFADESINTTNYMRLYVQLIHDHVKDVGNNHSDLSFIVYHYNFVKIPIIPNINQIDTTKVVQKSHTFHLNKEIYQQNTWNDTVLTLEISTNVPINFPINVAFDPSPIDKSLGIIYAAILILCLYIMIIWEIIDRTFAALLASTASIVILSLMNERPTMPEILSWIDTETLLLLFGMMILVGILSETGVFDYLAVYAFKITKGEPWSLIYCLCLFTSVLSAILDNVTTLLLMTPVSIRLCEIMHLDPIPILMSMIIFSNIGGSMTPVGDPPNIIIASNTQIVKSGVNFLNFTIHMSIGAVFVMVQTYFQLRYKFRTINDLRINEPEDIQELKNDIVIWKRAAQTLSSSSKDENLVRNILMRKIDRLEHELHRKITCGSMSNETFKQTLAALEKKFPIRDRLLLIKSSIALTFVIGCFFFHSLPYIERISLGWIALLGAILLLILSDPQNMETVFERVEWTTLVFFAVLFVLMESLAKLGLIDWIGNQTENIILMVSEEFRLAVAILIVLWVSAIASAFVDNIPLTTMMIRVIISLASKAALNLPLQPLVWALSFGACLGGNGTLIGASANIICAGVAAQYGYELTFMNYFKIAFPAMIGSLIVASGYLLICHLGFMWH